MQPVYVPCCLDAKTHARATVVVALRVPGEIPGNPRAAAFLAEMPVCQACRNELTAHEMLCRYWADILGVFQGEPDLVGVSLEAHPLAPPPVKTSTHVG